MEEHRRDEYHGVTALLNNFRSLILLIQIGTHADSLIAEAILKNITSGFDLDLAWEAVWKDAMVEPEDDEKTVYADREEVRELPGLVAKLEPFSECRF